MTRPVPFTRLLIVALLALAVLSTPQTSRAQDGFVPATAANEVKSALFSVQSAILANDPAAAQAALDSVNQQFAPLSAAFGAESDEGQALAAGVADLTAAVTANDAAAAAFARSEIWSAVLAGAYQQTIAAIQAGNLTAASDWLLVREYRDSTKFSRPGADATLAIRDLGAGKISTDDAVAAVRADLLDTYQANLEAALAAATDTMNAGVAAQTNELAGMIGGYWSMLAPSYSEQFGVEAGTQVTQSIGSLSTAMQTGDVAAAGTSLTTINGAVDSFRAAPLSADEQARRAGQLLLYLSLIPVEYGRGVKDGQVTSDIEIQEAQSFYEGAQAAFNDLRLPLTQQNAEQTAAVAALLGTLKVNIHNALLHQSVAEPDEISAATTEAASTLKPLFPSEWTRPGGNADFDVIGSLLDEMEKAVAAKQYHQAESARLEAYAIFESGPEKRLLAFAPRVAQQVESLFWQGSGSHQGLSVLISGNATSNEIRQTRAALNKELSNAQLRLGAGRPARGAIIFNAATIVFREGLEAVLILVSLMASMIGVNRRFKKPLAAGAIGALFASAILFVLARSILMSLSKYGEKLEAVVSLIAIGVLLLVMNWFFHKVYWTKWIAGHHARRRAILGGAAGQMIGLVILGFTSVFREGGETVLFLQALVLDAGTAVVIEGVLLGLAGVAVVGVLVFAMQKKLPHKKMLIVTGVMIAAVLVVMVGNTVHVLQVVGWAPITPVGSVQFPYWAGIWFGIYSTWEGLVAQAIALVFVIGSYYVAEYQHDRSLQKMAATTTSPKSTTTPVLGS